MKNGKLLAEISLYRLSPGMKLSVRLWTACIRSIKSNAVGMVHFTWTVLLLHRVVQKQTPQS